MKKLQRAYSMLDVKSVDQEAEFVTITGIASTPRADRSGDVVDPMGAVFTTPMPLLWQHDSMQPIGQVTFAKPNKNGIPFSARIPTKSTSATLQARLDEAIESIRLKLVAAVSIGFSVMDDAIEYIEETGGFLFKKWEWLELSAVTIPANADATIATVKSVDQRTAPASEGREALLKIAKANGIAVHAPRGDQSAASRGTVSLLRGTDVMNKKQDWINTRAAKVAAREQLLQEAEDKGETLDADQQKQFDDLTAEIDRIDVQLRNYDVMEKANGNAARPVVATNSDEGAAARAAASEPVVYGLAKKLPPGIAAIRIAICKFHAMKQNTTPDAIAERLYPSDQLMRKGLEAERFMGGMKQYFGMQKAAVPAANTTDTTYAKPLVAIASAFSDFVEFARPASIIGQFGLTVNGVAIPDLRHVPFNSRMGQQTSGGTGYWVGEGQAKPLTRFDYASSNLYWTKLAAIITETEELERFANPGTEQLFRDSLRDAINGTMDRSFIDPTSAAIAGVKPASITYGVNPITATGTTPAALRADLRALWQQWSGQNLEQVTPVYIMDATTALGIASMVTTLESTPIYPDLSYNGGKLGNIPVIVTNYATRNSGGGMIALVNATDVYLADDGEVTIDASREASLVMDSAPSMASSPVPVPATVVSMFQTNSIAIRGERYINWAKRRPYAVQYIANANYVG